MTVVTIPSAWIIIKAYTHITPIITMRRLYALANIESLGRKKILNLVRSCMILVESCKTTHRLTKVSSKILQDLTR